MSAGGDKGPRYPRRQISGDGLWLLRCDEKPRPIDGNNRSQRLTGLVVCGWHARQSRSKPSHDDKEKAATCFTRPLQVQLT